MNNQQTYIINHIFYIKTAQKMKFSIKGFFCKYDADLVTFTEEILNGKP